MVAGVTKLPGTNGKNLGLPIASLESPTCTPDLDKYMPEIQWTMPHLLSPTCTPDLDKYMPEIQWTMPHLLFKSFTSESLFLEEKKRHFVLKIH